MDELDADADAARSDDSAPQQPELFWDGVAARRDYDDDIVAARDSLADAARLGRWTEVLDLLDQHDLVRLGVVDVNSARAGGTSGFAPIHQAAWHAADTEVVEEFLARGAWRSLRTCCRSDRGGRRTGTQAPPSGRPPGWTSARRTGP